VKSFALSTFVRNYIVEFVGHRNLGLLSINRFAVGENYIPLQIGSVLISPVISTLINRCIGTFGFTSPTIDTFVGNDDGHNEYV
jgi:hypothetical protein